MKQVKVLIRDLQTLELLEDANKGDLIDLADLQKVDLDFINKRVQEEMDAVYKKQYDNELAVVKANHQQELEDLKNQNQLAMQKQLEALNLAKRDSEAAIKALEHNFELEKQALLEERKAFENDKASALADLRHEYELKLKDSNALLDANKAYYENKLKEQNTESINDLNSKTKDLDLKYQKEIGELQNKLNNKDEFFKQQLSLNAETLKNQYQSQIDKLTGDLNTLREANKANLELEILKQKTALEAEHNKAITALKEEQAKALDSKDLEIKANLEEIQRLNNQKSALSVKMIGEDLETWCNNEMESYLQVGLENCTWIKDNKVVKDEGDKKGSKADFIYKVYATEEHLDNELLASVCLDMKDEDPNSKNKQKNSHYYPELDKNRIKKNCKYAVLVSTLESDRPNALPIYKVREYKDMYVVQPAYMMTFLNMVTSLSMKFKDLLLKNEKEKLELIETTELEAEFEKIKNTYLDKPLEDLKKSVEDILKANSAIKDAANKIDDKCQHITDKYIMEITKKIERFNITRLVKKVNKINQE